VVKLGDGSDFYRYLLQFVVRRKGGWGEPRLDVIQLNWKSLFLSINLDVNDTAS
jgi:hypothetical protein